MPNLDVKRGSHYTLKAMYVAGQVGFTYSSNSANFSVSDSSLNEIEWERLVTWVAHQRAEEKVRRAVVK